MTVLDTDTKYKAVNFIETYTGRAFYPLDPQVAGLTIIDIAHALANQCRYSGHTAWFYSTAQHCCLLASWLAERGGSPLDCLQLLLHDAAECYLVDVPRPIKQFMPEYRLWDKNINDKIREWMGWSDLPIPAFQDELDSRIIVDERAALFGPSKNNWAHDLRPLGIEVGPWTPAEAEIEFLIRYAAYSKEVYGSHQYLNDDWGVGADVSYQPTSSDSKTVLDITQVDIRGGVAQVKVRNDEGILRRDTTAGVFPKAQVRWQHGEFKLMERVG